MDDDAQTVEQISSEFPCSKVFKVNRYSNEPILKKNVINVVNLKQVGRYLKGKDARASRS